MPTNKDPIFTGTPNVSRAVLAVANPNLDGTGTLVDLWTPGLQGGRCEAIVIKATGATAAGMVRIYTHDGAASRLLTEAKVDAVTPSATVTAFETIIDLKDLGVLPAGWSLKCSTHNAEGFVATALGGDF